jgi:hypothetical protein
MIELFTAIYNRFAQSTGGNSGGDNAVMFNALPGGFRPGRNRESQSINNAFFNTLSGGLWNTMAPQYPTYPYAVFQLVSDTADHLFIEIVEDVLLQFNIFDNSQSATTACNLFKDLDALYDNCVLAVSNYGFLIMLREFNHLLRIDEAEGGFWQYIAQYRIMLEKR